MNNSSDNSVYIDCDEMILEVKKAFEFKRIFLAYGKNITIDSNSGLFPDFASDVELTHIKYESFCNSLENSIIFMANNNSYFNQYCSSEAYKDSNGDFDYLMLAKCVGIIRDVLYSNQESLCNNEFS